MNQRFESRQEMVIVDKMVRDERKGRRWNTTAEGRQKTVDFIENTVADDRMPVDVRLFAAKIQLGIEAQNQADERLAMIEGEKAGREDAPKLVLVLPGNGSEVGAGEGDGDIRGDDESEVTRDG